MTAVSKFGLVISFFSVSTERCPIKNSVISYFKYHLHSVCRLFIVFVQVMWLVSLISLNLQLLDCFVIFFSHISFLQTDHNDIIIIYTFLFTSVYYFQLSLIESLFVFLLSSVCYSDMFISCFLSVYKQPNIWQVSANKS